MVGCGLACLFVDSVDKHKQTLVAKFEVLILDMVELNSFQTSSICHYILCEQNESFLQKIIQTVCLRETLGFVSYEMCKTNSCVKIRLGGVTNVTYWHDIVYIISQFGSVLMHYLEH